MRHIHRQSFATPMTITVVLEYSEIICDRGFPRYPIFSYVRQDCVSLARWGALRNVELRRNDNGNTHFLYALRKREKRTWKKRNEVTWGKHLSGHTPHLENLTLSQKSRLFLSESLSEGKAKHSTQNLTKCQE